MATRADERPIGAPVTDLPGVGPGTAAKLDRLGIETLGDLILHLPFRYQDRTRSVPFNELEPGKSCLVTGRIMASNVTFGRRRSLLIRLGDGLGTLTIRMFHFSRSQERSMQPGSWMRCFGDVRIGPTGPEMVHPEYRLHRDEPPPAPSELTPVYPATLGLTSARIRTWVAVALERCHYVVASSLADMPFADLMEAIRFLHAPSNDTGRIDAARERVVLDELTGHYLVMRRRQALLKRQSTIALPSGPKLGRRLLRQLGFRLTRAQAKATGEVLEDLAKERPMIRLLQGDVGSGKTVVAAFAAIRAAERGCQTAIMAPTEILAEQHFETLSGWLVPLGIGVGLLTGRQGVPERRARLTAIRDGGDLVAVGTHALFQTGVEFHRLALAIIDEQHRFGVHQRMQLRDKGRLPHQLVMTATPIPRTLTMALYADMDVSTIDELPPGRLPVRTHGAAMSRRGEVIDRVRNWCAMGRQGYWVCTTIEEDEETELNAAESVYAELSGAMPGLHFGLIHGRLPQAEKNAVMAGFKAGEIHILVATTVIEVGVDVPNASVMVIDNAERLGLAQLHQLRGRVGRGSIQATCILLYETPLSAVARERLAVMRDTNDGFKIAEKDLELRGPGDILGTRQTGEETFRLADLGIDRHLLPRAVALGNRLLAEDEATAQTIIDTWGRRDAEYAAV
ncbi:MAG: ATP-dependent DNA helicase RecG [Gammaproteobacteria bacterium]|nr:ATP-dependent DNA helicase RecG [Gammaproteobacteria bacterium]MYK47442.1 ATP-dependent DNA helicase RecG [Gammaproteobacteria bacterium]